MEFSKQSIQKEKGKNFQGNRYQSR